MNNFSKWIHVGYSAKIAITKYEYNNFEKIKKSIQIYDECENKKKRNMIVWPGKHNKMTLVPTTNGPFHENSSIKRFYIRFITEKWATY